jgi:hypothetical protein
VADPRVIVGYENLGSLRVHPHPTNCW